MVAFMFWNVNGRAQPDLIAAACRAERVDVLILAEAGTAGRALHRALNCERQTAWFSEVLPAAPRLRLFSRLPEGTIRPVHDGRHHAIRRMTATGGIEILLVAAHLPSRLHCSSEEQYFYARKLRGHIVRAEQQAGHANTVVIGDLNMNPFDQGMVAADAIHGMVSKRIAEGISRRYAGSEHEFFYNPMWSRLGDESTGPPGTYFRRDSGLESLFWHTFDQVLLRPGLLPYYGSDSVRVITRVGDHPLADEHRIDRSIGDHLPIVLELTVKGAG